MKPERPDHLVLYLSGRCNLACPYCYARGVARGTISGPALLAALRRFKAARPAAPKFTILGGEPLLCRARLRQALAGIKELFGPGVPVRLFTNGLLLKKGEAARLLKSGVKLTVSMAGRPDEMPAIPRALRKSISVSAVAGPANAGELLPGLLCLLDLGYERLAWAPDITAAWDAAALRRLRAGSRALLLEYLRRLKSGRGVWELANAYETIAAARGERPAPCRSLALAPDGFFYPCDKMLSGAAGQLRAFRIGADGSGREKFFRLAARGARASEPMCPVAPWAAARFGPRPGPVPPGQAEAGRIAAGWLRAAVKAGLSSPVFRRVHGI